MKSTERLQHLIYLLQSGKSLSARDLAEEFGVTKRTIYRDLNRLSELNIPITHDPESGYGIMSTSEIKPIMFTERELATVIMGIAFAKSQINQQLRHDADKVSRKINASLPKDLRDIMSSLEDKTVVDPFLQKNDDDINGGGNWFVVSRGITIERPIEFKYQSRKGDLENRIADPLLLVYYYDHWNVVGFCHDRKDIRNFNLERMSEVSASNEPPQINYSHYQDSHHDLLFRLDEPFTVRLQVANNSRQHLLRHLPALIKEEKKCSNAASEYVFEFDNYDYLNHWLLQYGEDVHILAPPELLKHRQSLLSRLLNQTDVSRETS